MCIYNRLKIHPKFNKKLIILLTYNKYKQNLSIIDKFRVVRGISWFYNHVFFAFFQETILDRRSRVTDFE